VLSVVVVVVGVGVGRETAWTGQQGGPGYDSGDGIKFGYRKMSFGWLKCGVLEVLITPLFYQSFLTHYIIHIPASVHQIDYSCRG
jgi:hypothetical protein